MGKKRHEISDAILSLFCLPLPRLGQLYGIDQKLWMEGRPARMTGIAADKIADKMICDQGRRSWLQLEPSHPRSQDAMLQIAIHLIHEEIMVRTQDLTGLEGVIQL
ncbi:hypothetical protein NC652_029092 [Populus alba x Populus x berolinensis]|nr:hypothetical protein NC652_029092 [Populus alba x Populus x berolinensis]